MAKKKDEEVFDKENKAGENNIVAKIWNLFSSMKLGIILLLVIAVLSIVGTVIEQNMPEQRYNAQLYPIYKALGLIDLYGTWYFKVLLFLLSFNLLVCSLNRWKLIGSALRGPNLKVSPAFLKKLKSFNTFTRKSTVDETGTTVESALRHKGYRVFSTKDGDNLYLAADKSRFGVLGSFITHLAFIVILIGGIIGGYLGFSGGINAQEGKTFNLSEVQGVKGVSDYFDVAVDKYGIEFYENGMPKKYFSDLRVLENGEVKVKKTIWVNQPLKYKGVTFYQSSWMYNYPFTVKVRDAKTKQTSEIKEVATGQEIKIPNSATSVLIEGFLPDYDPSRGSTGSNLATNPTLFIKTVQNGQQIDSKAVGLNQTVDIDGGALTFTGYSTYTGLQVKKDPGVPVVWLGSGLLVLGMFISFALPHRKVWAVISPNPKGATVEIGGLTQKNKIGFEKEYKEVLNSF